jgi:hypothetical protein
MRFKDYYQQILEERRSIAGAIATEIRDSLQSDKELTKDDVDAVVSDIMEDHGGENLGKGNFANVYGSDSGGYVVKVAVNDRTGRQFFLNMGKYDNPLFPKIEKHIVLEHSEYLMIDIYVLERLKVDFKSTASSNMQFLRKASQSVWGKEMRSDDFTLIDIIDAVLRDILSEEQLSNFDNVLRQHGRTLEQLMEFVEILRKTTKSDSLDVHSANFGFNKDGHLIIFDPISF